MFKNTFCHISGRAFAILSLDFISNSMKGKNGRQGKKKEKKKLAQP